jgi:Ca-activated chloride channel family protein
MRADFETYPEAGSTARPNNAIDVYILYSPESQQYMPRIIDSFNRASADGRNPATGAAWASGERPIYVRGQQPTTGSSGSAAAGIINAIIAPNNAQVYHPTIFQPSVSHWLELVNLQAGRDVFNVAESVPTALSPVVIGMWESRVRAIQTTLNKQTIGWEDLIGVLASPNGWADYGIDAGRRAVFYGHANPRISSTGLSANIAEYYACARENGFNERRLTLAAVNDADVQNCVARIEQLVRHYADSTEEFLEYINRGTDYLDMVALEETDLICLNRGARQGDRTCNQPQERLIAIYPEEGTFTHEHPFGIVNANWVTPEQAAAARIFTDFVLTPDMQRLIMTEGFRAANPTVANEFPYGADEGVDLAQPAAILDVPDANVIAAIQTNWSLVKRPADVMLVVDTSGSMGDQNKLEVARAAMVQFLSRLEPTTRVGMMSFSDTIQIWEPLNLLEQNRPALLQHITCEAQPGYVAPLNALSGRCLQANGSTSLYTAVRTAVDTLDALSDAQRIRAVIVLSDGQDTCQGDGCSSLDDVINKIARTRATVNPVVIIPIAYGADADGTTLNAIARASATRLLSGDPGSIGELLALLGSYF